MKDQHFKWESEYFFATFDWDLINIIPYERTSDTYLQSIQYQIIHRYFPCKYQLNMWNIEDSNKYTYCQEIDILTHNFVECESVRGFWSSLKAWFLTTFEFSIKFTVLDILLGIPNHGKNKDIDILNFVILFAKAYIYNSKRDEMAIDFYTFLVKLVYVHVVFVFVQSV